VDTQYTAIGGILFNVSDQGTFYLFSTIAAGGTVSGPNSRSPEIANAIASINYNRIGDGTGSDNFVSACRCCCHIRSRAVFRLV